MNENSDNSSPFIDTSIGGISLKLTTAATLFSPRRPDPGTLAMLSAVPLEPEDRLLDLGCGYGLVGIYAALCIGASRVTMLDVDPVAVEIAQKNAQANQVPEINCLVSDGFRNLQETAFTKILSHPPYHADFSIAKHFILKGFNRLTMGGEMWFVTKREKWYRRKLTSIFGGATVHRINGYFVFQAKKLRDSYANRR